MYGFLRKAELVDLQYDNVIRLENGDTLIQFYRKKHTGVVQLSKFIVDDPTYNDIIDKYYTIKKQKVIFR